MSLKTQFRTHVPGGTITGAIYRPANKTAASRTPLIILHGGPGGSRVLQEFYLAGMSDDQPVIFYDQLGSHDSPAAITDDLIKPERFGAELTAVLRHFDIPQAAILGHSWGAAVALEFATAYRSSVKALILSSPLISSKRWIEDTNILLQALPQVVQNAIRKHEADGTIDHPDYKAAETEFMKRHFCRLDPLPQTLRDSFKQLNFPLYLKMWGASEFQCSGTLQNYDREPALSTLSMPVLLIGGQYDESRPETLQDFAGKAPNGHVHILEDCSHTAYVEDTKGYRQAVQQFINNRVC